MEKLLKMLSQLTAKGFATEEEKAAFAELAEATEGDTKSFEALVKELSEEAPEEGEEEEGSDDEIAKQITKTLREEASKEIKDRVAEEVKAWKEKHAESMEKKAGLFSPEVKEARAKSNENVIGMMKALRTNDFKSLTALEGVNRKYLSGDTDADGGYTIDPLLMAEIAHLQTEYGVARREMRVIPMGKARKVEINKLLTRPVVYWIGEGAQKKSSQFTIGQEDLELKKLAAIIPWTDELAEDTEIDVVDFISGLIAEELAQAEDEAFFNGDGTSTYGSFTGVLNLAGANVVTLTGTDFDDMDADDLLAMQDATPQGALANGKYFMHRSVRSIIRKLKDNEGRYIYQEPGGSEPATLWNKPVVLVEAMPAAGDSAEDTPFVVFGDLKKAYYLGTKATGVKMDVATEATIRNVADDDDLHLFSQDMTAVRFVERIGGVGVLENAVTVLKTAAASA